MSEQIDTSAPGQNNDAPREALLTETWSASDILLSESMTQALHQTHAKEIMQMANTLPPEPESPRIQALGGLVAATWLIDNYSNIMFGDEPVDSMNTILFDYSESRIDLKQIIPTDGQLIGSIEESDLERLLGIFRYTLEEITEDYIKTISQHPKYLDLVVATTPKRASDDKVVHPMWPIIRGSQIADDVARKFAIDVDDIADSPNARHELSSRVFQIDDEDALMFASNRRPDEIESGKNNISEFHRLTAEVTEMAFRAGMLTNTPAIKHISIGYNRDPSVSADIIAHQSSIFVRPKMIGNEAHFTLGYEVDRGQVEVCELGSKTAAEVFELAHTLSARSKEQAILYEVAALASSLFYQINGGYSLDGDIEAYARTSFVNLESLSTKDFITNALLSHAISSYRYTFTKAARYLHWRNEDFQYMEAATGGNFNPNRVSLISLAQENQLKRQIVGRSFIYDKQTFGEPRLLRSQPNKPPSDQLEFSLPPDTGEFPDVSITINLAAGKGKRMVPSIDSFKISKLDTDQFTELFIDQAGENYWYQNNDGEPSAFYIEYTKSNEADPADDATMLLPNVDQLANQYRDIGLIELAEQIYEGMSVTELQQAIQNTSDYIFSDGKLPDRATVDSLASFSKFVSNRRLQGQCTVFAAFLAESLDIAFDAEVARSISGKLIESSGDMNAITHAQTQFTDPTSQRTFTLDATPAQLDDMSDAVSTLTNILSSPGPVNASKDAYLTTDLFDPEDTTLAVDQITKAEAIELTESYVDQRPVDDRVATALGNLFDQQITRTGAQKPHQALYEFLLNRPESDVFRQAMNLSLRISAGDNLEQIKVDLEGLQNSLELIARLSPLELSRLVGHSEEAVQTLSVIVETLITPTYQASLEAETSPIAN